MSNWQGKLPDKNVRVKATIYDHNHIWFGGTYQPEHDYQFTNGGWQREKKGVWEYLPPGVTVLLWTYINEPEPEWKSVADGLPKEGRIFRVEKYNEWDYRIHEGAWEFKSNFPPHKWRPSKVYKNITHYRYIDEPERPDVEKIYVVDVDTPGRLTDCERAITSDRDRIIRLESHARVINFVNIADFLKANEEAEKVIHKHMGNGYPICGVNFYQSSYLVHKDDWSQVTCPDCLKHKPLTLADCRKGMENGSLCLEDVDTGRLIPVIGVGVDHVRTGTGVVTIISEENLYLFRIHRPALLPKDCVGRQIKCVKPFEAQKLGNGYPRTLSVLIDYEFTLQSNNAFTMASGKNYPDYPYKGMMIIIPDEQLASHFELLPEEPEEPEMLDCCKDCHSRKVADKTLSDSLFAISDDDNEKDAALAMAREKDAREWAKECGLELNPVGTADAIDRLCAKVGGDR